MSVPQEHDYIGFKTSPPSMERILPEKIPSSSSSASSFSIEQSTNKTSTALNLKATELRLGLPGSHSPDRKPQPLPSGVSLFGKDSNGYLLGSLKNFVSGAKRGFSDAIDGSCGKCVLSVGDGSELELGKGATLFASIGESGNSHKGCVPVKKELATGVVSQCLETVQEKTKQVSSARQNTVAPAAKAQVVGWPPIRSFRKNTMAFSNLSKNIEDDGGKTGYECLYVKVSMDGAPYLRKVDLKTYANYMELFSGLKKMFSCFTIGQCGSQGLARRDGLNETSLKDILHGAEYVLTYEDKDGDWMLVGDVPWVMFMETCRRLRIMKGSEAAGLAPRAMEKSKYCT